VSENLLSVKLKIEKVITFFLGGYFNKIVYNIIKYPVDHIVNNSFIYFILKDIFFFILSLKNNVYYLKLCIKKDLFVVYLAHSLYSDFILEEIKNYVGIERF